MAAGRCPSCNTVILRVEGGPDPRTLERLSFAVPCGHRIDYRTAVAANVPVIIDPTTGVTLIGAERRRQVTEEGYTPEHDDRHNPTELPWAVWTILDVVASGRPVDPDAPPPKMWPWGPEAWKPDKSPMRNLTIGGAMLAAELDRRLRTGETP